MTYRIGCVYLVRNKLNGKKYVGQTLRAIEQRWSAHVRCAVNGLDCVLHRAIRKYGAHNFTLSLLGRFTEPLLDAAERRFIIQHESHIDNHGYNLTAGDEGGTPSNLVRKKISKSNTGKVQSDVQIARKSLSLRAAYKLDPTLRRRTGGSWKGKTRTAEDVANRRASLEKHYKDPNWIAKIAATARANWTKKSFRAAFKAVLKRKAAVSV